MTYKTITMEHRKKIALVAHDHKKRDLLEWARYNRALLAQHEICATGTTGRVLEQELDIKVSRLQSGPLGGDQQIGSKIVEGDIDFVIFFWDPLEAQPHDPDVKALLRMAVVWNIPIACNRASAVTGRVWSPPVARTINGMLIGPTSEAKRSVRPALSLSAATTTGAPAADTHGSSSIAAQVPSQAAPLPVVSSTPPALATAASATPTAVTSGSASSRPAPVSPPRREGAAAAAKTSASAPQKKQGTLAGGVHGTVPF